MLHYLRLPATGELPDVSRLKPFRTVVVLEQGATLQREEEISKWLVESGCLYMMAWGPGCSRWDDSVDMANLEQFKFKDIPEESDVMTTWHEKETLEEVFDFSKRHANHHAVQLKNTLILHLGEVDRGAELQEKYSNA